MIIRSFLYSFILTVLYRLFRELIHPRRPVETVETHPWLFALASTRRERLNNGYHGDNTPESLKKSWDLLMEHLDSSQAAHLIAHGEFTMASSEGRTLLVRADWSHVNVYLITRYGEQETAYCTAPVERVPIWDHILAQVLAIRYDFPYFYEKAIRSNFLR